MRINGKEEKAEGRTLLAYLRERQIDLGNVAVERNGDIVPKSQYASVLLQPEDVLEIVSFVGGAEMLSQKEWFDALESRHGAARQAKFRQGRVAICGLGGLAPG